MGYMWSQQDDPTISNNLSLIVLSLKGPLHHYRRNKMFFESTEGSFSTHKNSWKQIKVFVYRVVIIIM